MKKSIKIVLLIVLLIIVATLKVYAADNSVTLTSSATNVKVGDTIIVTVTAKSDKGIEGLDGTLKFNSSKLQFVNEEEISEDGLSQRLNDNDAGKFQLSVLSNGKTSITKELKFKVLNTAQKNEKLVIEFVNIDLEDSEESDQPIANQVITLTVVSEGQNKPGDNPAEDPTEDPAEDPTEDPAEDPTEDNKKEDNTTADKNINYAGLSNSVSIITIVLAIISLISYVGYRRNNI